jgi:RimJ/RimL family protein N-acetyltransferase
MKGGRAAACRDRMQVFLETERMLLRRFTAVDADNLVDLDSDPEVMRYLSGGTPTPRGVIESVILPRFLDSYGRRAGFGYWAAIDKATDGFIGWFGFNSPDRSDLTVVELGYRLRRAVWGRGYATEGSRALIRTGFTNLGVRRVVATTYEHNRASRRVMEKLGMKLVRRFRLTPEEMQSPATFAGASQDVWEGEDVEYALDREDWERQEAASGRSG